MSLAALEYPILSSLFWHELRNVASSTDSLWILASCRFMVRLVVLIGIAKKYQKENINSSEVLGHCVPSCNDYAFLMPPKVIPEGCLISVDFDIKAKSLP